MSPSSSVGCGERFARSHSTGHSIGAKAIKEDGDRGGEEEEEEDRTAMRLPERVRLRILTARRWTASCEACGEFERDADLSLAGSHNSV